MICSGCYKITDKPFCLPCRKKLFEGAKVQNVLGFDTPNAANFEFFQKNSKRLSISGVQLKYSLRLEADVLVLADRNGQFILKPIPPAKHLVALEDVPANEHLTMQLAEQIFKIPTAANALIAFKDGNPAYLTRRFDVKADGSKYLQEDFAQLLNRTGDSHGETFKYDGSYEDIARLIGKQVAAAPPALERFFKLIVFNYIVSNGDAHLKNFSLIRMATGEYQLTPAYDLLSTIIHTPGESDTALYLYEHSMDAPFYSTYGYYGRPDFLAFAKRLGLVEKRAVAILEEGNLKENEVLAFINNSLLSADSKSKYEFHFKDKVKRLLQS